MNISWPDKIHKCPLCESTADYFCSIGKKGRNYYRCAVCSSVFLHPEKYIDHTAEQLRYEEHNNDVKDKRYQNFVSPITTAITNQFSKNAKGLDYGCGTGPVASVVLEQKGFDEIALYDPFFQPHKEHLSASYDFIICCEVMEHFHHPQKEFALLNSLLKSTGKLFCKTSVLKTNYDEDYFKDWWYNNDPTHVFFYTTKTLEYIADHFNFNELKVESQLITFGKGSI